MSAPGIETVLAAHLWDGRKCRCNCWPSAAMMLDDRKRWLHPKREDHAAHVADALRAHLLSEAVVERAARAVHGNTIGDPAKGEPVVKAHRETDDIIADARAALTAATEGDA